VSTDGLSTSEADAGGEAAVEVATEAGPDAAADAPDAAPADPNLVGEWHFDESSGTVASDTSGRGRPARLAAGATFTAGGQRGGGVELDGTTSAFVDVTALDGAAFPRTGTLSLWYRRTLIDTSGRPLFDNYTDDRAHIFLRQPQSGPADRMQVAFQPVSTTGAYAFVTGFTDTGNTWRHVIITWDEAGQRGAVWVDGLLVGEEAYSAPFAPTGQRFRLGERYGGRFDEVRLWDRVLTADEIALLP
jgi:hypothetical protein